ncbi:MAG: hypothetical protein KGO96_01720 [Elusimicrobia bacterium]|nr:hypothetical protein [Elusimicrobiota bacterium]MDE2424613.1 hypothetical protein [Elusimicrobiota bacterium]
MRRLHRIQFAKYCQRAALAAAALALASPPLSALEPETSVYERPGGHELNEFLRRLARMHADGSMSLDWRNVGPRKPGFETQIQNEVYLADMYFGIYGPFFDDVPFQIEMNWPTASQGRPQLNQLNFSYRGIDKVLLQFGKLLVPYGRYNELYRPDQFLTVTRPLLYASPDSLDLVVRLNSPRPPLSLGYTDVGARASVYPDARSAWIPDEATLFVVNGLGETNNRLRTFPNTDNLGIPGVPGNGSTIDFGHQDNNLADNNNQKTVGGRLVFSLGDLRFPWPIPEGASDLKGVNIGFSGMDGQYDLEGHLNYQMYCADWSFDYLGFDFSGEYEYAVNQFLDPLIEPDGTPADPVVQRKDFEVNRGYFVQAAVPLLRHPAVGRRLTGVLVFNQLFRRGPIQDLLLNTKIGGTVFASANGLRANPERATTRMDKYTAALNYQLTDHFTLKFDYSYWVMGHASTRSVTSLGLVDIYQSAFSVVMSF